MVSTIIYVQADVRYNPYLIKEINDKKVIEYTVEKLSQISDINTIVFGLFDCEENHGLRFLETKFHKVKMVYSLEEHVGKRMYESIKSFNPDFVIRVTGEQIFLDTEVTKQMLEEITSDGFDVYLSDLTDGRLPEIIKFTVLEGYRDYYDKYDRYYKYVLDNTSRFLIRHRQEKLTYEGQIALRNQCGYRKAIEWMHHAAISVEPILVYTVGKVGSKTIVNSLKSLNVNKDIYDVHFLSDENHRRECSCYRSKGLVFAQNVQMSRFIREELCKKELSLFNRYKIISLIRDPVAITVSSFFQNIDSFIPDFNTKYHRGMVDVPYLLKTFFEKKLGDVILNWFDDEMKSVFGIDVFKTDFPKDKGYTIIYGENSDLLLIRLENLNACARKAFEEFLGVEKFVLKNANCAKDKEYYSVYQKFIKNIKLPDSYLKKFYCSRIAQHFYTKEEIERFVYYWTEKKEFI